MDVGERIASLRVAKGWSMNRLAKEAEVAQSYVSDMEKGSAKPTIEIIERICSAMAANRQCPIGVHLVFMPAQTRFVELECVVVKIEVIPAAPMEILIGRKSKEPPPSGRPYSSKRNL